MDTSKKIHKDFYPTAAIKEIPDWYKNTPSYLGNRYITPQEQNNNSTTATVKKCLPFFDSMTAGYIIKSHIDILVRWEGNRPFYQWPNDNPIEFQAIVQAQSYPGKENRKHDYPKFNNPWSIRTPKGYSSLIMTPTHRDLPFNIFEGIVDTDTFFTPILFPFYLKKEPWEGVIEAGTPIAQVIPFKRDSWNFKISEDQQKLKDSFLSGQRVMASYINAYRKSFWKRKEWT